MIVNDLGLSHNFTVKSRLTHTRILQGLIFLGALTLSLGVGYLMIRYGPQPRFLAWLIYFCGIAGILYQPRWGLYMIVFFGLVGDSNLLPWYPFVKNFSSIESVLYLNDALIFSPLESYLVLTLVVWLGRDLLQRKLKIITGSLVWPAFTFLVFVTLGLVYGVSSGGSLNIALWEVRPFYYLVLMTFLGSNLFEGKKHLRTTLVLAFLALSLEGFIGAIYFFVELGGSTAGVEQITEHSAAIHMNTFFILVVAVWLFRDSLSWRFLPLVTLPFILITYLVTQRRAAFLTLAIGIFAVIVILFFIKRNVFWIIAPLGILLGTIYLGIFWNSSGIAGLPARAVKSMIATDNSSTKDQQSNFYRYVENVNSRFTIRQKPITGVGFGNRFYVIWPMADISFFEWWNYFPHNSFLYIWVKGGLGTFIAMLYLFGVAIFTAGKSLLTQADSELRVFLIVATTYIMMHLMYTYVDIAWDSQSTIYLGLMLSLINISAEETQFV